MRMMVAKEYFEGQVPLVGEYSIYKCNDKHFFTVGDGHNSIEKLVKLDNHIVLEIPKLKFDILKRFYDKYSIKRMYSESELSREDRMYLDLFYLS